MRGSAIVCLLFATASAPAEGPPVAIFAELEGRWEGTFVGYDATGRELYRIQARHRYRTVDASTQEVEIEDRMEDGTVVRGRGVNRATRGPSGELEIVCDVRKSNGDRVQHRARRVRGPLGERALVWHSASAERSETFREAVVHDGTSLVYQIDGMGRYGDLLILMAGRYRKVPD